VSTAIDSSVFRPMPSTIPSVPSSHRAGAGSTPAAVTSRPATAVVANTTANDAASSRPSPISTSRSNSTRTTNVPGYSGSRQMALIDDRRASIQNHPEIGRPMNPITPTVPRASRNASTSTRGRFSAR